MNIDGKVRIHSHSHNRCRVLYFALLTSCVARHYEDIHISSRKLSLKNGYGKDHKNESSTPKTVLFLTEYIFCQKVEHFFGVYCRSQSSVSRAETRIVFLCEAQTRCIRMKNYKNNTTRDCGKGKRVEISIKHRRYGKIMLCEKNSNWRWHFSITLDTLHFMTCLLFFPSLSL